MAGKEVQVYFKLPRRSQTLLRRLENSFLESVIEFKPTDGRLDPWRAGAFGLESAYQLKGNVSLIDEEILIQFVAKNAGIHTARIFSNTREICHPIAFVVTKLGQVQSYDSFMSAKRAAMAEQDGVAGGGRGADTGFHSAISSALASGKTTLRASSSQHSFSRVPEAVVFSGRPQDRSKILDVPRSHPPSTGDRPPPPVPQHQPLVGGYTGHAFHGDGSCTFDQLYGVKVAGGGRPAKAASTPVFGAGSSSSPAILTPDILRAMDKEAKLKLSSTLDFIKAKKRCNICSRKMKAAKAIHLWGTNYCDGCCKRSFILRSAIEHFMPPTIQECTVQIPVNKRGTKFATTRKVMPNVNLRGLDPGDIRNAQMEFSKFDMEGDGWIDKAVLMPVVKACFTYTFSPKEIRALLSSEVLKCMMRSMGLDRREKVHEIEFLSILAFIARERQRINLESLPNSKFSHNDLQLAYAFQSQFGISHEARQMPRSVHDGPDQRQHLLSSFEGISPDSSFAVPMTLVPSFSHSPLQGSQQVAGNNSVLGHPCLDLAQTPSPNQPRGTGKNVLQAVSPLDGIEQALMGLSQSAPPHKAVEPSQESQLQESEGRDASEEKSVADRNTVSPITFPTLSPPGKASSNPKNMMEELKLTGDMRADAWMMY